jgi:hypothetical protein
MDLIINTMKQNKYQYETPLIEELKIQLNKIVCLSGGGDAGGGENHDDD